MARPWTTKDVITLRRLTEAGVADPAIARRLGRTPRAVGRMRERVRALRRDGRLRRRVLELARLGCLDREIAEAVGRSRSLVQWVRAAAGVGPARPGQARNQREGRS